MNFPAAQLILSAIFLLCLGTLVAGALIAVASTRLIRGVCGLAICSIGLAGLYYFLHSPFLALMEILIYIGAVCVTIIFAVMLAEPDEPANEEKLGAKILWGGMALAVAAVLFGSLGWLGWQGSHGIFAAPTSPLNDGSIQAIGHSLLTTYSLAFELISLALLVAIIGALAIARAGREKPVETAPQPDPLPLRASAPPVNQTESGPPPNGFEETPEHQEEELVTSR
jgi:NADH:ubiquinone oxidoreductase subunit 6 (subunit J)